MRKPVTLLLALLCCQTIYGQADPPVANANRADFGGKDKWTFSMPGSRLLFGGGGQFRLVQPSDSQVLRIGGSRTPSLSRDGDLIAWATEVPDESARVVPLAVSRGSKEFLETPQRPALALYFVQEQKTLTIPMGRSTIRYGDPPDWISEAAISPDGDLVAFTGCPVDCSEQSGLFLLEIATGRVSPPLITDLLGRFDGQTLQFAGRRYVRNPSWSPDGTRLVLQLDQHVTTFDQQSNGIQDQAEDSIAILDIQSGEVKIIAKGRNPAWSPTGEWIAYLDEEGESCMLIRADGTGQKKLKKLGGFFPRVLAPWISFTDSPVWSPDGKKLLLNRYLGETLHLSPIYDVVLLDVATGKMKRKRKNVLTITGWAAQGAQ